VRGEFISIGVLLFGNTPAQLLGDRWTEDWWLVRIVDPDADLRMLRAMCRDLSDGLREGRHNIQQLSADLGGVLQLSSPTAYLVEDAATTLDELQAVYLERKGGRARIITGIEKALALIQSVQTLEGSDKDHVEALLGDELADLDVKVAS